jgi:small-conductance mechanosensitive channel
MPLDLLDRSWYGATLTQWLIALAVLGGVYLALSIVRRLISRHLYRLAARTSTEVDDLAAELVSRTRSYFIVVLALQAAVRFVAIPLGPGASAALRVVSVIVVLVQVGVWLNGLIGFGAEHYGRQRAQEDPGARATIQAVGYAARFVAWTLLLLTALRTFGVDITALVTGLGVGGIAVALAVQNILGDLFAALAIVLDKPFVVGETIHVDTIIGTVEHIGLKTTRLRSLGGEQIVISNADLLKSRIRNYKRMQERRVVFSLDVTYDTPPELVERIPGIVREVVESYSPTRFDRCHFLTWMESSLRIEAVYYVLDADYLKYADIQHAINIELLRRFAAHNIQFAFPSRTLHVKAAGPTSPPAPVAAPTH